MVSRANLPKVAPRARSGDMLELMCEAYWNAFRIGYCKVGGRPEDYPTWKQATDPVKDETRRCMRHAVEVIKDKFDDGKIGFNSFDDVFPHPPLARGQALNESDTKFVTSQKIARMGE